MIFTSLSVCIGQHVVVEYEIISGSHSCTLFRPADVSKMKDESTNPPGGSPRKAVAAVNQHVFGSFIDEYLVKPSIRKNSDFPPFLITGKNSG